MDTAGNAALPPNRRAPVPGSPQPRRDAPPAEREPADEANGAAGRSGGRWPAWLTPALSLAVLGLGVLALVRLAGETSYEAVVTELLATPAPSVLAAVCLTLTSFTALTFCDHAALRVLGEPRPWRQIAPGAFSAFAIAHSVGFGPLTGVAVRLRYYVPLGIPALVVARVLVVVMTTLGTGLAVLLVVSTGVAAGSLAPVLGVPRGVLILTSLTAAAGLALLYRWARRHGEIAIPWLGRVALPDDRASALLLAVSLVDLAASAGVVWVLLPGHPISFAAFLPVFTVAVVAGIASHVPAGLGVFEAVLLAGMSGVIAPAELLAALALYRIVYSVMPVAIAALAIAFAEIRRSAAGEALSALAGLAPQAAAALALILGAMLVFSGVTPSRPEDLDLLARFVPLPLLEGAHFIASVLGAFLMLSARGLAFRARPAWAVATILAPLAAAASLVKAIAAYEAVALTLLTLLLLLTRREFPRPGAAAGAGLSDRSIAAATAVLIGAAGLLAFVHDHTAFSRDSWLTFEFVAEAPRGLRALVGAALVVAGGGLWALMRPRSAVPGPPTPSDLAAAVAIVDRQPSAEANLVRMGDKHLLFSADRQGFIMYGRRGSSRIALFDPVGPHALWPELVCSFVEMARRSGGRAAFYEVGAENLAVYADFGLTCLKLGEEARVDLAAFTLEGSRAKGYRNALSRGVREGLAVEIPGTERIPDMLPELGQISDEWLAARGGREKGFSLGWFAPDYVASQRVAVLRRRGRVVAFATLMETACREEVTVDLMRFREGLPHGAMEFLFLRLFEHFKADGVRWFGLGMAPLAGLSESPTAPTWHRLGHVLFEHGNRFYGFKGLRAFKDKFRPVWTPRFLAVSSTLTPALALLDAARLIGGPRREEER